jgi:hypothetical protein
MRASDDPERPAETSWDGRLPLPAKALPIPGDAVETGWTDAGERIEDELRADRDDAERQTDGPPTLHGGSKS